MLAGTLKIIQVYINNSEEGASLSIILDTQHIEKYRHGVWNGLWNIFVALVNEYTWGSVGIKTGFSITCASYLQV